MQGKGETWLEANECAARIGLSKRALRLYEEHGLIRPRRTEKGWRLYGADEIARLHEILALKRMGLSLQRITALLQGKAVDLAGILGIQHDLLAEQRKQAEQGLALVRAAQAKLAAGASLTADELIRLAKEANMSETTTDTVAWRRYEQARPRTEIKLDPRSFQRCTGFYRHPAGLVMAVTQEGDRFFLQLTGQPRVELFAENDSNFFLKVVPAQLTFTPAEDGNIDALILHQGGHDTVATRIDEAEAKRLGDELGERVRNRMPDPRSEATLRELLEQQQRGSMPLERLSEPLAELVREQQAIVTAELETKGSLQSLDFRRVREDGVDIYKAQFAKGVLRCGIGFGQDGRVHTLWMRPA
ncbi:MAG: MerR family transcriptional regulator [Bosea sp.]|uniref:MerR family transcriptional regulator n=1 Tax=Bosea sp. (in: a-proteobacteria) TaxID=1871050 RepID=UPI0023898F49|nr:MerR family transcriptional regulator [Bosea sp. (in: a-proteobacteria)]MCP4740582.1 MerR family transcriptional regulator [Bosea sp. (in: a-proteobacteria)]